MNYLLSLSINDKLLDNKLMHYMHCNNFQIKIYPNMNKNVKFSIKHNLFILNKTIRITFGVNIIEKFSHNI